MESKTIENIAICAAVVGAFILIAYIIKKYDKIVLKWKDISATFGSNSTTESSTESPKEASKENPNKTPKEATREASKETPNKSPKEASKETPIKSPSKVEDSENIELKSNGKKIIEKSDPKLETQTKELKPKLEVELPPASSSNITNFANIKQDHEGIQTNNETTVADDISVTKDATINNVANIDIKSQGGENNKTKVERKITLT